MAAAAEQVAAKNRHLAVVDWPHTSHPTTVPPLRGKEIAGPTRSLPFPNYDVVVHCTVHT